MGDDKRPKRFLCFTNEKEEEEKAAKFREAAQKIEKTISTDNGLAELVDYVPISEGDAKYDPATDSRSLFERLQEQKDKKSKIVEESQKFSNLISTLDEDEAKYLNDVIKEQREEELRKKSEAQSILSTKKRANEDDLRLEELRNKRSLIDPLSSNSKRTCIVKPHLLSKIRVKPKLKTSCETSESSGKS